MNKFTKSTILLAFFYFTYYVNGAPVTKKTELPMPMLDADCRDYYKIYLHVNASLLRKSPDMSFVSAKCMPEYKNQFCMDNKKSYNWKDFQKCILAQNSTVIECPLWRKFTSYKEFGTWKATTTIMKIRGYDYTKTPPVIVETKSDVITPLFRCPDIGYIHAGNRMFVKKTITDN